MVILAIDTSCDETSVAVVDGTTILANVQPSQMEYHKKYGGVVPNLARLAHQQRIDNVILEALKRAGLKTASKNIAAAMEKVSAIAVTIGPGLAIALEVGISKAKQLASDFRKPLITVNHMEGHLLSGFAKPRKREKYQTNSAQPQEASRIINQANSFPALGLLISGGHTEIVLVTSIGQYEIVGETLDDSCGECLDKCGRMLGLGYPAGPLISQFAKEHRKTIHIKTIKQNQSTLVQARNKKSGNIYKLPIAMAHSGDFNMSYSGLKTAFKQLVDSIKNVTENTNNLNQFERDKLSAASLSKEQMYDLSVVLEAAAYKQIELKLEKAIEIYNPREIWLGGGVVASPRLRSIVRSTIRKINKLSKKSIELRYPYSKKLTTDNAAMIGLAAYLNIKKNKVCLNKNKKLSDYMGIYVSGFEEIDRLPNFSL